MPETVAHRAIADLIVILHKRDKSMRRKPEHRPAMRPSPTLRIFTVVNEAAAKAFRELRDRSEIGQVASRLARQDGVQRVMKIVVPLRIETIASSFARRDDSRLVEIAFRDHDQMAPHFGFELIDLCAELLEKVNRG